MVTDLADQRKLNRKPAVEKTISLIYMRVFKGLGY